MQGERRVLLPGGNVGQSAEEEHDSVPDVQLGRVIKAY